MIDLEKAKELLDTQGYTCVLCRGESLYTSKSRGVKPLVEFYKGDIDLSGFSAADKVVGKATAFLYILQGVSSLYASVISRPALDLLEENHISVAFGTLVPHIINRKGDGICPFEDAVMDISEPQRAYEAILEKMKEMKIA